MTIIYKALIIFLLTILYTRRIFSYKTISKYNPLYRCHELILFPKVTISSSNIISNINNHNIMNDNNDHNNNIKYPDHKEDSRKLRRTVYTTNDWKRHRSSERYFKELKNMPKSIVIRGLFKQAGLVALFSTFIVIYNLMIQLKIFKISFPLLSIPSQPFSLLSPSLGLLLVFRTNAAYARWTEGRTVWSVLSSQSFDFIRQSICWMDDKAIIAALTRHVVAFSKCLHWQLTHREDSYRLRSKLIDIMTITEVENIMKARNKCQFILIQITKLIRAQGLIISMQTHMDKGTYVVLSVRTHVQYIRKFTYSYIIISHRNCQVLKLYGDM